MLSSMKSTKIVTTFDQGECELQQQESELAAWQQRNNESVSVAGHNLSGKCESFKSKKSLSRGSSNDSVGSTDTTSSESSSGVEIGNIDFEFVPKKSTFHMEKEKPSAEPSFTTTDVDGSHQAKMKPEAVAAGAPRPSASPSESRSRGFRLLSGDSFSELMEEDGSYFSAYEVSPAGGYRFHSTLGSITGSPPSVRRVGVPERSTSEGDGSRESPAPPPELARGAPQEFVARVDEGEEEGEQGRWGKNQDSEAVFSELRSPASQGGASALGSTTATSRNVATSSAPPLSHRRTLVFLGGCLALLPLCGQTYTPTLSLIQTDLDTTNQMTAMTLTLYLVAGAASAVLAAPLSDRWGRRPILMAAAACVTLSAICSFFVTSILQLILCRMVMGVGVQGVYISASASIGDLWQGEQRAQAHNRALSAFSLAVVVGPLLGGLLAQLGSWRTVFLFLTLLAGTLLLIAGVAFKEPLAPESLRAGASQPIWACLSQPIRIACTRLFSVWVLPGVLAWSMTYLVIANLSDVVGANPPLGVTHVYALSPFWTGMCFLPLTVGMYTGNLLCGAVCARWGMHMALLSTLVFAPLLTAAGFAMQFFLPLAAPAAFGLGAVSMCCLSVAQFVLISSFPDSRGAAVACLRLAVGIVAFLINFVNGYLNRYLGFGTCFALWAVLYLVVLRGTFRSLYDHFTLPKIKSAYQAKALLADIADFLENNRDNAMAPQATSDFYEKQLVEPLLEYQMWEQLNRYVLRYPDAMEEAKSRFLVAVRPKISLFEAKNMSRILTRFSQEHKDLVIGVHLQMPKQSQMAQRINLLSRRLVKAGLITLDHSLNGGRSEEKMPDVKELEAQVVRMYMGMTAYTTDPEVGAYMSKTNFDEDLKRAVPKPPHVKDLAE